MKNKTSITHLPRLCLCALLAVVCFKSYSQDSIKVYTVKWCLYYTVQDPCPDAGKTDKFGRVSSYGCLVYHCHTESKCDSSKFLKRKEAIQFYNEAKKESGSNPIFKTGIQDVKIDSVWVNNR